MNACEFFACAFQGSANSRPDYSHGAKHSDATASESVVSTEGYAAPKKEKVKKHKTKPMAGKNRKSRKSKSGAKSVATTGSGDGGAWSPDPNALNDKEWLKALQKFFKKFVALPIGERAVDCSVTRAVCCCLCHPAHL